MEPIPQAEQALGYQAVQILRGFKKLDRRRRRLLGATAGDLNLNDIDVVQPLEPIQFQSEYHAIEALNNTAQEMNPALAGGEFTKARVLSLRTYIRALDGADIPIDEYIDATLDGAKPVRTPEIEIKQKYNQVSAMFEEMGYGQFSPENWGRYYEKNHLTSPNQIAQLIEDSAKAALPVVQSALGRAGDSDIQPHYKIRHVQEDAYWINWMAGSLQDGHTLSINYADIALPRWFSIGVAEHLGQHEIVGHLQQAYICADNIRKGLVSPALGITTVPGPEQYHLEGSAIAITRIFPELFGQLSNHGKLALRIRELSDLVWGNNHELVNGFDGGEEEAWRLTKTYLHHETDERIKREFISRTLNHGLRSYRGAYEIGAIEHRRMADTILRVRGQSGLNEFAQVEYNQPMTRSQVTRLYRNILHS